MLYQPGPWSLTKEGKVTDASGNCVLIQGFSSGLPGGETAANTLLCLSAPELVESLELTCQLLQACEPDNIQARHAITHANALIARINSQEINS
ncbi:hypothetical protein DT73_03555 [Mangrovibacter sp. MFB070]|uniref:hypothetical protein n=1 Tax=Mangrovibacter sp. MFB070 TaxID=1224318 RepID=UPI0004DACA4A|nr:hypothetical protein [Mangrovibacter sp. MFB070]KEA54081.1 hypothetical protein DT73_03555 [Mangrovibacter sp. MFB070]